MIGIQIRLLQGSLALLLLSFSTVALTAKPPPEIMQSIDNLAMTGASLNNCFESSEFKKLSTQQAARVRNTSSRIENIVTRIQDHYRDRNLLPAYYVAVAGYMESVSIKKQTIQRYSSLCSSTFIDSVETYVDHGYKQINAFLTSERRK